MPECDADDEVVGFGAVRSPSNTKSARATWVPAASTITSAVVVLSMTTSNACPSLVGHDANGAGSVEIVAACSCYDAYSDLTNRRQRRYELDLTG